MSKIQSTKYNRIEYEILSGIRPIHWNDPKHSDYTLWKKKLKALKKINTAYSKITKKASSLETSTIVFDEDVNILLNTLIVARTIDAFPYANMSMLEGEIESVMEKAIDKLYINGEITITIPRKIYDLLVKTTATTLAAGIKI